MSYLRKAILALAAMCFFAFGALGEIGNPKTLSIDKAISDYPQGLTYNNVMGQMGVIVFNAPLSSSINVYGKSLLASFFLPESSLSYAFYGCQFYFPESNDYSINHGSLNIKTTTVGNFIRLSVDTVFNSIQGYPSLVQVSCAVQTPENLNSNTFSPNIHTYLQYADGPMSYWQANPTFYKVSPLFSSFSMYLAQQGDKYMTTFFFKNPQFSTKNLSMTPASSWDITTQSSYELVGAKSHSCDGVWDGVIYKGSVVAEIVNSVTISLQFGSPITAASNLEVRCPTIFSFVVGYPYGYISAMAYDETKRYFIAGLVSNKYSSIDRSNLDLTSISDDYSAALNLFN